MANHQHVPVSRAEVHFSWYVTCGMPAYAELAGVSYERTFFDRDAIVKAYDVGYPLAVDLFGPDVRYSLPGWSGISYGHVNCLGSTLVFPEGSDVAHTPIHKTLADGISALQHPVDWASAGLMPEYITLWEQLKAVYPDMGIRFQGFGVEGPLTTAWELRGHDFFMDLYDDPHRTKQYLELVTSSIVDYMVFQRQVNGEPAVIVTDLGMVDDISALFHPKHWLEFVVPFQQAYFTSQTTGSRRAHIEGLTPAHLPFLDLLLLDSFDPSVSPNLCPEDIRDRCEVIFWWRLNAMQVRDFTPEKVRDFVYNAVAGGASGVFANVGRIMTTRESALRLRIFMNAAVHVTNLILEGIPPSTIDQYKLPVSHYI